MARERLPRVRQSRTYSFRIEGTEGYAHVGVYEDGRPGELFVKIAKQGSTLAGICDAWAVGVSIALQNGAPLEVLVDKYVGSMFEPRGNTDDEDIPKALSIVDYLFRRIGMDFLDDRAKERCGL